jgi:hypothetical protein
MHTCMKSPQSKNNPPFLGRGEERGDGYDRLFGFLKHNFGGVLCFNRIRCR